MMLEELGVAHLLPWSGLEDDDRRALDQRLGAGESAGLADQQVAGLEQHVDFLGEPQRANAFLSVPGAARDLLDPRLEPRVHPAHHHHLRTRGESCDPIGQLGQRTDPAATTHQHHHGPAAIELEMLARLIAPDALREARMHGDPADLDAIARDAVAMQLVGDLVAGDEVAIDVRVHPDRMRGEVGDHAEERDAQRSAAAPGRQRLDREEVRAHDGVGVLALHHAHQPPEIEAIHREANRRGALVDRSERPGAIERAPQTRRTRGHGVVGLRVGRAIEP
jgi:hypothetical protein